MNENPTEETSTHATEEDSREPEVDPDAAGEDERKIERLKEKESSITDEVQKP